MTRKSNLQRILDDKQFALTAEVGPPKGCDPLKITKKAEILNGYADAFNESNAVTYYNGFLSPDGIVVQCAESAIVVLGFIKEIEDFQNAPFFGTIA